MSTGWAARRLKGEVVYPALRAHIRRFFKGHRRQEYEYTQGPPGRIPPNFRVVRVAPGPRTRLTTYLSLGSWEAIGAGKCGLEFLVTTSQPEMKCVELLAMVAYYHRTEGLGVGHTFPLGYGWLGGSCDHMLVSLRTRSARTWRCAAWGTRGTSGSYGCCRSQRPRSGSGTSTG
jgi:hypothetical protein